MKKLLIMTKDKVSNFIIVYNNNKTKRGIMRYNWDKLNKQQVGTFSEYFVKMELTMHGFQVYTTEIDDRGIDFVMRYEKGTFFSIQVKSIRRTGYVYMQKEKFELSSDLYLALVILDEGNEPKLFLIPSTIWNTPNELFVDHNYEGGKSKPEWGLNLSRKNMHLLEEYSFSKMLDKTKKL